MKAFFFTDDDGSWEKEPRFTQDLFHLLCAIYSLFFHSHILEEETRSSLDFYYCGSILHFSL